VAETEGEVAMAALAAVAMATEEAGMVGASR